MIGLVGGQQVRDAPREHARLPRAGTCHDEDRAAAMGHGKDYVYPHEHEGHFAPQQYLPKRLLGTYFYAPSEKGYESQVKARLKMWRAAQRRSLNIEREEHVPDMTEEQIVEMKRKIK